jgi:hypothetical protein
VIFLCSLGLREENILSQPLLRFSLH